MARSKGGILLARASRTQEVIAAELGITRVAVHHWLSGTTRPSAKKRGQLAARYGIPPESWDEPSDAAGVDVPQPSPPKSDTRAAARDVAPEDDDPIVSEIRSCRTLARALLVELQTSGATMHEKSKVLLSALAALERASKLTGEYHLGGARLLRLPFWKRVERALADGLKGHPAAAAAVERELRKLEDEFSAA